MAQLGAQEVERIYRDHGHVVLRRARRILGDDAEAGEVLQEVFLSLLDRPEQFEGRSAVTTFLYAVTTNACLNRIRARQRRVALIERHADHAGHAASDPDAVIDAAHLLGQLPERLARVAVFYFVDEMTHEEIAEILGLSRRQVGNLVARIQREARKSARAA